jgi:hypothetical protein
MMTHKLGLTLGTTLMFAIAGMVGSASKSAAGPAQELSGTATDISAAKKGGGARSARSGGPRSVGRGAARHIRGPSIRRNVGPRRVGHRSVGQRSVIQRSVGQRSVIQRSAGQQPTLSQNLKFGQVKVRHANRAKIAGRNYSIWRGSHRVHRGGRWLTFVGLGALSTIMVGSAQYYPYAYIDAPAPLCEGLTEDGCQLRWQTVPIVGGPPDYQCVAYCPWQ